MSHAVANLNCTKNKPRQGYGSEIWPSCVSCGGLVRHDFDFTFNIKQKHLQKFLTTKTLPEHVHKLKLMKNLFSINIYARCGNFFTCF